MVPFCCCCNYATIDHIGIQIFNFVVLSVIIAPHNILTPHISTTYLLVFSLNVCELSRGGRKPNSPRKALRFIKLIYYSI